MIHTYSRFIKIRNYEYYFIINIIPGKEFEINEIYSSMTNALSRLIDLTEHILAIKQTRYNIITVNICNLEDSLGTFHPRKTICISNELLKNMIEFEKTFFHELVHYLFMGVFEINNSYLPHLSEAVAVYFENYYYSDYNSLSILLLYDRLTINRYAAGYYMIDQLIRNDKSAMRLILNKNTSEYDLISRREIILNELTKSECSFANELILKNIDILLIEPNDNYLNDCYGLIYRSSQMNSPIITKIEAGDLYKYPQKNISIFYDEIPEYIKEQLFSENVSIIDEEYYELIALYYGKAIINNYNLHNKINNTFFLYY